MTISLRRPPLPWRDSSTAKRRKRAMRCESAKTALEVSLSRARRTASALLVVRKSEAGWPDAGWLAWFMGVFLLSIVGRNDAARSGRDLWMARHGRGRVA